MTLRIMKKETTIVLELKFSMKKFLIDKKHNKLITMIIMINLINSKHHNCNHNNLHSKVSKKVFK